MFSLTEKLENTVMISGSEFACDLSFNNVIQFYELLEDDHLQAFEKIELAFCLFLPELESEKYTFAEKQNVIESIIDYIQESPYGNEPQEASAEQKPVEQRTKNFSYTQDAGAIYASFMQDYGIDLLEQKGKMHFLTFKALLNGLSDKTYFQRIVGIREETTIGKEGETLTSLVEAQEYYALEENKAVDHLDDQMGDMFAMLKNQALEGKEDE